MKTLIAEDDPTSRKLLSRLLGRYGECQVAANGQEAVSPVRSAHEQHAGYDLVCMT